MLRATVALRPTSSSCAESISHIAGSSSTMSTAPELAIVIGDSDVKELFPGNQSVTLKTLARAAEILGMRVQIELVDTSDGAPRRSASSEALCPTSGSETSQVPQRLGGAVAMIAPGACAAARRLRSSSTQEPPYAAQAIALCPRAALTAVHGDPTGRSPRRTMAAVKPDSRPRSASERVEGSIGDQQRSQGALVRVLRAPGTSFAFAPTGPAPLPTTE